MTTPKSISNLLGKDKFTARDIKDYAKVNNIFRLYVRQCYDTMAREIYWYKAWDLFRDLSIYMEMHYKNDMFKKFVYRDMWEEFEARLDSIWHENDLKKARKDWLIN
jgi:hypothetical protein